MNSFTLKATRTGLKLLSTVSPTLGVRAAERLFSTPRTRAVSPKEAAVLAQGRALSLKSGLAATVWGEGDTVLLVHGWERHRASLSAFVTPLLESGKRVVAFDAPAHNDSPGRTANPFKFTQAILAVADDIGDLAGIVGHSVGGGATVLALHEGLKAERAVLLAAASDWEYQLRFFTRFMTLTPAASDRFVNHLERQAGRSLATLSAARLAPTITQPVLLFHDSKDGRVPYRDSVALHTHLPNAELVTLEGSGHSALLHDPAVVSRTIAFLDGRRL